MEDAGVKTEDTDDDVGKKKGKKFKGKGKGKGRDTGVRQAKIVRQADRVDAVTGKGRSKGYGFLELGAHADALRDGPAGMGRRCARTDLTSATGLPTEGGWVRVGPVKGRYQVEVSGRMVLDASAEEMEEGGRLHVRDGAYW